MQETNDDSAKKAYAGCGESFMNFTQARIGTNHIFFRVFASLNTLLYSLWDEASVAAAKPEQYLVFRQSTRQDARIYLLAMLA